MPNHLYPDNGEECECRHSRDDHDYHVENGETMGLPCMVMDCPCDDYTEYAFEEPVDE